jgi:hypothetical protein
MDESQQNPLRQRMSDSIASLEAIAAGEHPDSEDPQKLAAYIAEALRLTLAAMADSMGECRQALPFSPLHPVLDTNGHFRWCCNHDPQHCSTAT